LIREFVPAGAQWTVSLCTEGSSGPFLFWLREFALAGPSGSGRFVFGWLLIVAWWGYVWGVLGVGDVRRALVGREPALLEGGLRDRAAVAIVLTEHTGSLDLLLIERARRAGDPWSGQMAFPGGRVDPGDVTVRAAAERETFEEVGLSLAESELLGRLDDLPGRPAPPGDFAVSAFVFYASAPGLLSLNHEVRDAFWFPLDSLSDRDRYIDHPVDFESDRFFPGILVGDPGRHVVWGLTYRFLDRFLNLLGKPLPKRAPGQSASSL
jgi:8-oxo-dGTP pyrophosphatase MutT (NUDIX family)